MNQGRSIRLFLVDGSSNGLLTAEIINWTGHVITGPRSKLSELVQRPEVGRTGIYLLIGPNPENSLRPLVYIGESDDVGKRLKQHNKPESQGGKDFWERVCLVTSKDQNITKAHAKHLESLLIARATQLARCKLVNGTSHDYSHLPEADIADMAFFAEQIRTVLPVLGYDFLRDATKPSVELAHGQVSRLDESPTFFLQIPKHGIQARARELDGEFIVLAGSQAKPEFASQSHSTYQMLHEQLAESGVLVPDTEGLLKFASDESFSSPSAAAAVISGRSANGRTAWVIEHKGQTYADWQEEMLNITPADS